LLSEFAACSVFALPSFEETSPVSIAEAMALGKAVLATKVGGVPELIEQGKTGYLVEYADTHEIGRVLGFLLQNSDLRQEMGRACRTRAKDLFHPRVVAKRTVQVFEQILREEASPL
jgi:glycosyltransferase involved in cell wall biosynthesis